MRKTKQITPEQLAEGVNSIYEEKPAYAEGHDGSDGLCDCIGMPRGGSIREGVSGIENFRGTNQAARKTLENLQPLKTEGQLCLGDVVLKTRDKDDEKMPLPDRYRKGGSDYDAKIGETNFTHIGTVTRVDPLEITHMTSPTAKKDSSIKGWSWFGSLPWVSADGATPEEPEPERATVWAEKGTTVKMRAKPSTLCRLYWDVPVGCEVVLVDPGGTWSEIIWAGRSGWMMTKYLMTEQDRYAVTIPGLTKADAEALCTQWTGASMRKE